VPAAPEMPQFRCHPSALKRGRIVPQGPIGYLTLSLVRQVVKLPPDRLDQLLNGLQKGEFIYERRGKCDAFINCTSFKFASKFPRQMEL
jgi:hypothetical protein